MTELVLGGAPLGGLFAPVSEHDALETLRAAWDGGIRSFDTAPHYGLGISERRMGRFLASRPRTEFTISTKVGRLLVPDPSFADGVDGYYETPELKRVRDYSADGVRRSLEESLARLELDRVDQVLIHDPDDYWQPAVDQAYPELERMRAEGVIDRIGVGMNQVPMLERFVHETDIDCVMVAGRYTLLDRSAGESLFEACADRGVSVIVAGVFNSGVLADPENAATFDYAPAPQSVAVRARELAKRCASAGVDLAAVAMQFPRRHAAVDSVVIGARSAEEVRANLEHWHITIPEELWADLG